MPRESYKRGSDNTSKSSKDKACVFCMVKNGNEGYYAVVPGIGFMDADKLDATLGLAQTDRIDFTLSVSEFTTSSKSASDSSVTSAEWWNEID